MRWMRWVLLILLIQGSMALANPAAAQETPPEPPASEELEFGQAPIPEESIVKVEASRTSVWMWGWVIFSILAFGGLVAGISYLAIRRWGDQIRLPLTVADLPGSVRVMFTLALLILGLVHLFGMSTAYIMSTIVNTSVEEYFFYMKIGKLTGMTHAHLFGTMVMHLVVATAFLFTTVREPLKVVLITATILGSPADIASWWLIKYVSPLFEALALAGEVTSEIGYLTMTIITLIQLWRAGDPSRGKTRSIVVLIFAFGLLLASNPALAQQGTEKKPPADEEGLQLEAPALAPVPSATDAPSLGPFTNINFGGTLDYRFLVPTNGDSPSLGIHVNELFLTTNIGDNITILAEQLLLTSDLETVVGQDHGFVYAIFTNLPLLPSDLALKVGRLRFRYGIDAVSDAPVNPARDLVYKNLGFISDKGLEVSGYHGDFDYTAAVLMGPDFISQEVLGPGGVVTGEIKIGVENNNRPVAVRLGYESPWDLKIGLSAFYGKAYRFVNGPMFDMDDMLTNGFLDRSRLVLKRRASLDLRYGIGKWDFSGEVTLGDERDAGETIKVRGYYIRADYLVIPQKVTLSLQYDLWRDGLTATRDDGVITGGVTFNPLDQVTLRLLALVSDATFSDESDVMDTMVIVQTLLTF